MDRPRRSLAAIPPAYVRALVLRYVGPVRPIVINDVSHELCRLQVKSGNPGKTSEHAADVGFTLSRRQLGDPLGAPLFYVLIAWVWSGWSFIVISREALNQLRENCYRRAVNRRHKPDEQARRDAINLTVCFRRDPTDHAEDATLWGESLRHYLNRWPAEWRDLQPGRAARGPRTSARP